MPEWFPDSRIHPAILLSLQGLDTTPDLGKEHRKLWGTHELQQMMRYMEMTCLLVQMAYIVKLNAEPYIKVWWPL